ncbi:MAG: ATP-binding protein [Planctomycetaceae bacterium]
MIKSLRWRLQIWHAVILAVVLSLFGGYSYALQWESRMQQVDAELDRTARRVIYRLRFWAYSPEFPSRRPRSLSDSTPPGNNRGRPNVLPGSAAANPGEAKSTAASLVNAAIARSPRGAVPALNGQAAPAGRNKNPAPSAENAGDSRSNEGRWRPDNLSDGDGRRGSRRNARPDFPPDTTWKYNGIRVTEDMWNVPEDETTSPLYFAIWNSQGELLQKSEAAPVISYPGLHRPSADSEQRRSQPEITRIQDGRREVVYAVVAGWTGIEHNVVVGRSITDEMAAQQRFLLLLIGAGSMILVVGMLGGGWLTSRAIQPITVMSRTASSISATNLKARIDVHDTDTELGQLGTVLNQTFDRLQSAFEQQVRFTADASHELRTPVSILLAQTQMALSKPRSDEDYREALDSCRRAALRMKSLTESLLSLARFDTTDAATEQTPVELHSLIDDAVDLLQPVLAEHGVAVSSSGGPCTVVGDANQLSQLLMNLISNAIRYNRPRGRVDVRLQREDANAVIVIQDTGMGIATDDLPHLFERFYRIDKARSRAAGGSGLGLSIARAIVESHGGEIAVESELDVGTTVTVTLPCSPSTA